MKPRSVYIAGPMRGYPNWNYDAFHAAEEGIREANPEMEIKNPARNFAGQQGLPFATYMRVDIESVMQVDAVVVLPRWYESIGASIEVAVATALGIPVYNLDDYICPIKIDLRASVQGLGLLPRNEVAYAPLKKALEAFVGYNPEPHIV